ncbi:lipopolysaccharide transport periplasmic protein LptA [Rubellimicrobium roseum]|uniref:Lipopolysaccharide transport periplasmic protein LptA n=1 Tax=Rubellimicrobium roseum TaxID=687525 RepID=A0A5C4NJG6_9RHOB|nr:lipopolysaccharide transport periplasmic protein LptA [Rubellimicrobium roseum]TNC74252.1 lipopolysaccharide transport periplasmic protein LptA [Rubellimicrobium roseum]
MTLRAVLLALLFAPGAAPAQSVALGGLATDPSAPVEVTSETLTVDQATGAAVFTGNVVIGQGDLRLSAAEVEVRYDEATQAIARLLASGGVTLATPTEAAEAREADYDLTARTLTLTGDVLLTQGQSAISADRMVVDLAAGTAQVEGNVRTLLNREAAP